MKFFNLGLFIYFLVNCVHCRDLWSADLPNVVYASVEKGKPIHLQNHHNQVQISGLTGTLYSDSLSQLHNVTELRICRNQIRKLEKGALCSAPNARILEVDFYGNEEPPALTKDVFENCDNIEELLVIFESEKPSKIASDAFQNIINLKKIVIQGYEISHLKKDFFKFNTHKFTSLFLSFTNIKEVDGNTFENFENLEEIGITNNKEWSRIPFGLFKGLSKLKTLTLRRNALQNLTWNEFEGLSSLEELDISSNQITSFDADIIAKHLPSLKRLTIYLNPLPCKQKEAFVNRLKTKLSKLKDVEFKFDPGYYDSCEEED